MATPPKTATTLQRDGVVPDLGSDDAIEAYYGEYGQLGVASTAVPPFAPGKQADGVLIGQTLPPGTKKVGWTVWNGSNKLLRAFAFNLNPQTISRQYTTRTQMAATRSGFFVDNFGQGPTTITISQLLGSGRPYGGSLRTTARYDAVKGFYENIYKYVVERSYSDAPYTVCFHDNHWWSNQKEKVFFPANSFQVQRAVNLQNVWAVTITMVSLDSDLKHDTTWAPVSGGAKSRIYLVKRHDSLQSIARKALGIDAPPKDTHGGFSLSSSIPKYINSVVALNKGGDDISKARRAPLFSSLQDDTPNKYVKVGRLQLYPGERILLPA